MAQTLPVHLKASSLPSWNVLSIVSERPEDVRLSNILPEDPLSISEVPRTTPTEAISGSS